MRDDEIDLGTRLHEARLAAFLAPEAEVDPNDEVAALLAKAASVYSNAIAEETRKAYVRRWHLFEAWCSARGFESLPASPETVMLYLADSADGNGVALATLRGWTAAIARVHLEAGLASPTDDPAMSMFLKGLARMHPSTAKPVPVQALRIGPLRDVIRLMHANAVDSVEIRDRAILGLHAAGIGDGEMTRLHWEQVRVTKKRLVLILLPVGRQKSHRERRIPRLDDEAVCPVAALEAWQAVTGLSEGPVFRLVTGDWVGDDEFRDKRIFSIRKSRVDSLGRRGEKATPETAMRLLGRHRPLDVRDTAILLVGFAGAFRRGEVTNLRWSDIRRSEAGLVVHLRKSKTDQEGRGSSVGIPYGRSDLTCPVKALLAWRERVTDQLGEPAPEDRVFTHVGRAGRITDTPLSPAALTRMVSARAEAAGLEGKWGGRSLRAGFISTAADLEVPLEAIATQSRHATLNSLVLYVRREDPFRRNPAGKVGL